MVEIIASENKDASKRILELKFEIEGTPTTITLDAGMLNDFMYSHTSIIEKYRYTTRIQDINKIIRAPKCLYINLYRGINNTELNETLGIEIELQEKTNIIINDRAYIIPDVDIERILKKHDMEFKEILNCGSSYVIIAFGENCNNYFCGYIMDNTVVYISDRNDNLITGFDYLKDVNIDTIYKVGKGQLTNIVRGGDIAVRNYNIYEFNNVVEYNNKTYNISNELRDELFKCQ